MDHSKIADLRCKEVINICDGARLGFPCDVEIDMMTGKLAAIVVPGPSRFFGLFGRSEDYVVPWCQIKRIGEDTILVEYMEEPAPPPLPRPKEKRRRYW